MIEYIIAAAMCIVIGYMAGYFTARVHDNHMMHVERESHKMAMNYEIEQHAAQVAKNGMMFEVEKRELTQRHTKILDEIAQVTGIDVVNLPSFGTVHLNHSKTIREAMKALYEEDEEDLNDD